MWVTNRDLYEAIQKLDKRLDRVLTLQGYTMALIDDLKGKVDSQSALIDAVLAKLNEALASGDPAKVQAIIDIIDANNAKLSV